MLAACLEWLKQLYQECTDDDLYGFKALEKGDFAKFE
jgi:hypothetical protein